MEPEPKKDKRLEETRIFEEHELESGEVIKQ